MIAKDCGRGTILTLALLTSFGALTGEAGAQLLGPKNGAKPAPAAAAPTSDNANAPQFKVVEVPVNPTDPIAVVNQEIITRQQLADECVAREGKKVLEAMIARRLIEQAIKERKLDVTAAEIDAEIERIADQVGGGVSREHWLRMLDKEKGISPAQYARDIIYPSIALRKLASSRVQVTPQDMQDAFEANFGERLHCRIIMVEKQRTAIELWEELRKNPAAFESLAKTRSTDTATRALGGMLPEPIARHAFPRNVSDPAYQQLVDGDPKDTDPNHKPKDGDISGPIQVNENAWVLIKREKLDPAKGQDPKNPQIRNMLYGQMFDVKLKDAMNEVFNEALKASRIENRLTGSLKLANEDKMVESQVDGQVKTTGGSTVPGRASTGPESTPGASQPLPPGTGAPIRPRAATPPAGVPSDAVQAAEATRKSLEAPKK
ncbi:MAG: SurA N-terminal domain-containing protein [Isosphaeraceae bacterium]|nr:SurA N-terminal domain-containing protein [Isosphaeraceae bacterium]